MSNRGACGSRQREIGFHISFIPPDQIEQLSRVLVSTNQSLSINNRFLISCETCGDAPIPKHRYFYNLVSTSQSIIKTVRISTIAVMFVFAALVLIATPLIFQVAHGTSLCKENEWFNHLTDMCQQCKVCPEKSWLMAPCVEFQDAMCVDLVEIARSIKHPQANNEMKGWRRWHEMEGMDDDSAVSPGDVITIKEKIHQTKAKLDDMDGMWSQVILVVLCLSFISLAVFVIMMAMKCSGRFSGRENNKTVARARLFSRDRLNTTEYMNNLATLDRRLAIDEILEKRKRAIFEPQLLNENIYSDEVFVDISGLPRNFRGNQDYEELDHRKCLLQMQERQ